MTKLNDFKIRDCRDYIHATGIKNNIKVDGYLSGKEAVLEYIRQKSLILKNELWWDYDYGLDISNLNEWIISFWLRECIETIEYIKEIKDLKITKKDRGYFIDLVVVFEDDDTRDVKYKL